MPASSNSKRGKVIFPAPEGMDLEGKEEGDTIEFVGEAEIEKGGRLCLKKLNGIELAGYEKEKEPERDFTEAVTGDEYT